MGWKDWFSFSGTKATMLRSATVVGDAGASTSGKLLECTPALLAQSFLTWVVADLEGTKQHLKSFARENLCREGHNPTDEELEDSLRRFLSFDKETALFRQLCLFYDSLWYKFLLPQLISKTGRIPHDSIEAYRNAVRQKSMEIIATAEYLPEEWRNWGTEALSIDMQSDFEFYMHGVVPPARREEFDMILNFMKVRDNGPVYERLAWLHMRTREILGLVDKKEHLFTHVFLWKSQVSFISEVIEKFMLNVVPIPE